MDAAVTGALVGGGFAFCATALNLGYNYVTQRQQRAETYRTLAFEKVLAAHQDAYQIAFGLLGPLMRAKVGDTANERTRELLKLIQSGRRWHQSHALYLNPESRSHLGRLFLCCENYDGGAMKSAELWNQWNATYDAILLDVGDQHLDPEARARAKALYEEQERG